MKDKNQEYTSNGIEIAKTHTIDEVAKYRTNAEVTNTIIKKSSGKVSVMSFESREGLTLKTPPFDTYAQIIGGKEQIVINKIPHLVKTGNGIVIPAHTPNYIIPHGRFRMILTIVRSGYE